MRREKTISEFEFLDRFNTEGKAVKFFEQTIWPQSRYCPTCGGVDTYKHKSRKFYYHCRDCRKQFSCRTNTIMQASPLPVRKWLYAMYKVSVARKGISSMQLSKEIGITQKSAWHMLQRIKEACGNHGVVLISIVEIDETYIGGKESNKHKHKQTPGTQVGSGKQAVIGMRERGGRVKAKPIARTDMRTLNRAVGDAVEYGATVYTDDHTSYNRLHTAYRHATVNHSAGEYVRGAARTNSIESVWALLKRGVYGTYHPISRKHLHRYIDEFTFRLNEGSCETRLIARIASLCAMSVGKRLPYQTLIGS